MLELFTVITNERAVKGLEIASLFFFYLLQLTVSLANEAKQTVATKSNAAPEKKGEFISLISLSQPSVMEPITHPASPTVR